MKFTVTHNEFGPNEKHDARQDGKYKLSVRASLLGPDKCKAELTMTFDNIGDINAMVRSMCDAIEERL